MCQPTAFQGVRGKALPRPVRDAITAQGCDPSAQYCQKPASGAQADAQAAAEAAAGGAAGEDDSAAGTVRAQGSP